jgi:hypothetical protein
MKDRVLNGHPFSLCRSYIGDSLGLSRGIEKENGIKYPENLIDVGIERKS